MTRFIEVSIGASSPAEQSTGGTAPRAGRIERLFRDAVIRGLSGLRGGQIVFEDASAR